MLLGLALLIALAFEFVNGFHDTANAVATVIYTHSLQPQVAVVYSGTLNFLGVLSSSGAVAFAIVSLLPVELILQVGQGAGFAMIFALLIAAIVWNIGTWMLGLPASSSHTLIGSIIGVGVANQLMADGNTATSGVDWSQAMGVFRALLFSPVVGFVGSAMMLIVMKLVIKDKRLYTAPATRSAPPLWIRGLLCLTCGAVSFAHGSNDGQKGMGLIMLILIGALPTAYALNRAVPDSQVPAFVAATHQVQGVFESRAGNLTVPAAAARGQVTDALKLRKFDDTSTYAALASLAGEIGSEVQSYGSLNKVPAAAVQNIRNDMFMVSEAIRVMAKQNVAFTPAENTALDSYKKALDSSTKFIPTWVKVASRSHWALARWSGEAHRHHRRREDRQDPHELRSGCISRTDRRGNDRSGGRLWAAGFHHACVVQRRGRHHGGERGRPAMGHGSQHDHGLGAHLAGGDPDVRLPVLPAAPGHVGTCPSRLPVPAARATLRVAGVIRSPAEPARAASPSAQVRHDLVMPTKVGIYVFSMSYQRHGWWPFRPP